MFIRVEDQSGNLTIWLNVNQIAKLEESRSSEELMGYSVTTVDNKEYYSCLFHLVTTSWTECLMIRKMR